MQWWQAAAQARALGDVPEVPELTHDSRLVQPGWAFAALPGVQNDGHAFIENAVRNGAAAVVVQSDHEATWSRFASTTPLLVLPDVRESLGLLASAVHGDPSQKLRLV